MVEMKISVPAPYADLMAPYIDERGKIQTLLSGNIGAVQIITSGKDTVRANHYHKTDSHHMYVVSGLMRYFFRDVHSRQDPRWVDVRPGEMVFTPPMVEHAVQFLEETIFINIANLSRSQELYEADLVRVNLISGLVTERR